MKQITFGTFLLLILLTGVSSLLQVICVGPNGKFSEQTLSLPYAFYNDSFGFAVGYVHGVVGRPQKQGTLLATAMACTKGSRMGFLVGRGLQMPRVNHESENYMDSCTIQSKNGVPNSFDCSCSKRRNLNFFRYA